jgi:hypothetical protein
MNLKPSANLPAKHRTRCLVVSLQDIERTWHAMICPEPEIRFIGAGNPGQGDPSGRAFGFSENETIVKLWMEEEV